VKIYSRNYEFGDMNKLSLGAGATGPKILKTLKLAVKDWEYVVMAIQKRTSNTIHGLEMLKAHENHRPESLAACSISH
jgi:hypothetical protein